MNIVAYTVNIIIISKNTLVRIIIILYHERLRYINCACAFWIGGIMLACMWPEYVAARFGVKFAGFPMTSSERLMWLWIWGYRISVT